MSEFEWLLLPFVIVLIGGSDKDLGLCFGIGTVGYIVSCLTIGHHLDRFNPKRSLQLSSLAICTVVLTIGLIGRLFVRGSLPMNPVLAGKVELGGIVTDTKHPNGKDFAFGPQMVEISRDGKRVYWTNSLYSTWDDQFYPNDEGGQMVMADVGENGGLTLNKDFYIDFPKGLRSHQIRLEGGDCSTDSFCYPSV